MSTQNNPMGWEILIPIIAQYGFPLAEKLFQKWASGNPPTQADFDELRGLISQASKDRMKAVLSQQGIPLDSAQAAAFLALV